MSFSQAQLLPQDLKPQKSHPRDVAPTDSRGAGSQELPSRAVSPGPASAGQTMTFVEKVWSINNAPRNPVNCVQHNINTILTDKAPELQWAQSSPKGVRTGPELHQAKLKEPRKYCRQFISSRWSIPGSLVERATRADWQTGLETLLLLLLSPCKLITRPSLWPGKARAAISFWKKKSPLSAEKSEITVSRLESKGYSFSFIHNYKRDTTFHSKWLNPSLWNHGASCALLVRRSITVIG